MELRVDGRRVFAVTGGQPFDPAHPAVVFLHGAAFDHTGWALQARWFAHHGRAVLVPDLPGHGRSEGPFPPDIPQLADWTVRLLDAAGVERAALVGHSMGALIALDAAGRHPDRVWALALLGLSYPMQINPEYLALARANDHKAIELMNDWQASRRMHIGGNRVPGLWLIGGHTRLNERAGLGILGQCLTACGDYRGGLEAARQVRCPTLVLLGGRDAMTPHKEARTLAREIPSAELAVLKDCGHVMMTERPDETLDALKELV